MCIPAFTRGIKETPSQLLQWNINLRSSARPCCDICALAFQNNRMVIILGLINYMQKEVVGPPQGMYTFFYNKLEMFKIAE